MGKIRVVFGIGGMHGGGAERQVITLLQHLDRTRFEPFLYLIYRTGPLLKEVPADVPVQAFDERWKGSRWPGLLMHGRRVDDMKSYLREVNADVCYDRTFLMTLVAAEAAQAIGIPNVSTVVTEPHHAFPILAGRFPSLKRRMLKRLYLNSSEVLANSDGAAAAAEDFYHLPNGTIRTIYNAIDLERIDRLSALTVSPDWWVADADRPVLRIVTAGRLTTQKGFHLLIDAVAKVQQERPRTEIRLAILGDGPDRDAFQNQIKQLGLESQIGMPGFQENPIAWYKLADLMALPSLFEGFPNVLMEAMACGTAVLSSDCPYGPSELLEQGRWGQLCTVGDRESLTSCLLHTIDQPEAVQSAAVGAQQHVRATFCTSRIVSDVEVSLQKAVEGQ